MKHIPQSADVAIVGGGIIGLSVAYHLGKRGIKALILERGHLGEGSTARSSGGIRRLFASELAVRLSVESVRFWEQFEDATGQSLDWRRVGYLLVARSENNKNVIEKAWQLAQRWAVPAALLTAGEVHALIPHMRSDDILLALHCPTDGFAGPYEAMQAFRAGATSAGAVMVEECEVTAIEVAGDRVSGVRTSKGNVSARVVVNAAGPWAPCVGKLVGLDIPVSPRRAHQWVVQTSPPHFTLPCTIDMDSTLYVRPEGDKYLLGFKGHEPIGSYDTAVRPDAFAEAAEVAIQRFPIFESARLVRAWAGLVEDTPDRLPIIGPAGPTGYIVAAGFNGHGFMQAPAAGKLVAEYVSDGYGTTMPIEPFFLSRFDNRGSAE